jgi:hypothetical protein
MNFKSIGISATAALTLATGTALMSAPAEAISLTGTITLTGDPPASVTIPNLTTVGSSGNVVFNSPTFVTTSGDFASLSAFGITINPLPLTLTNTNTFMGTTTKLYTSVGANPFINFGTQTLKGVESTLSFVLNPGIFTGTFTNSTFSLSTVGGPLIGKFVFGSETIANGTLTAFQTSNNAGYQIALEAEPIPTPALLPGLVGFGIAALRKRKGEAVATTESEA